MPVVDVGLRYLTPAQQHRDSTIGSHNFFFTIVTLRPFYVITELHSKKIQWQKFLMVNRKNGTFFHGYIDTTFVVLQ
jgi:hypothetical protein